MGIFPLCRTVHPPPLIRRLHRLRRPRRERRHPRSRGAGGRAQGRLPLRRRAADRPVRRRHHRPRPQHVHRPGRGELLQGRPPQEPGSMAVSGGRARVLCGRLPFDGEPGGDDGVGRGGRGGEG